MTESQKLEQLKKLSGESDESILLAYLGLAGEYVIKRAYPFHPDKMIVPAKYHSTQIEIALYLLNKRGAEGEISHSENGISRSYENASVPDSMLKHITPHVSVLGFRRGDEP